EHTPFFVETGHAIPDALFSPAPAFRRTRRIRPATGRAGIRGGYGRRRRLAAPAPGGAGERGRGAFGDHRRGRPVPDPGAPGGAGDAHAAGYRVPATVAEPPRG